MKKFYILFFLFTSFAFSQTTFNPGEVMLTGFYFDGENGSVDNCAEGFAFVSFVDILDSTEIRFSEEDHNQWSSGTEGDLVWTNTTGVAIPALTAIVVTTNASNEPTCMSPSVNLGTVAFEGSGVWVLSYTNSEIIVFQGSALRTLGTPISMLQTNNSSAVPGMNPNHVIDFNGAHMGVYSGPSTFTDFADFVAQITDVATNWDIENDNNQDDGDDGVYPDYPDDLNTGFSQVLGLLGNEFVLNTFKMYPNPASGGFVNIASKFNGDKSVQVYDLFGKLVISDEINSKLNVNSLSTGVYMVMIKEGATSTTKKLTIN